MKKLTTLLLLLFPTTFILAQFQIGISGAFNGRAIANQNNYGFSELEYKPAFGGAYGLYAGIQFGGRHAFNVELNNITLGQAYEETIDGSVLFKDVKLKYWQIPAVFNIGISRSVKGNITYLVLGGYYSTLSSADITWKINDKTATMIEFQEFSNRNPSIAKVKENLGNNKNPADYKTLFDSKDLGVIGGVGFKCLLSEAVHLLIELRGGVGFTDINAKKWQITSNYKGSKNLFGGLKVGLGMSFGEKKLDDK